MRIGPGVLLFLGLGYLLQAAESRLVSQGDAGVDTDSSAVYASVLPSETAGLARVAILGETRAHLECLPPSPDWSTAVQSYKSRNASARPLETGLELGVPYELIPPGDFVAASATAAFYKRFAGGKVFMLSAVGFDPMRTRAIVTLQYFCGPGCGGGSHFLREKRSGRWMPAEGAVNCGWIS
jgi:hypothetical protein